MERLIFRDRIAALLTEKSVPGTAGPALAAPAGPPAQDRTIRHHYSVRFPRDPGLAPVESQSLEGDPFPCPPIHVVNS